MSNIYQTMESKLKSVVKTLREEHIQTESVQKLAKQVESCIVSLRYADLRSLTVSGSMETPAEEITEKEVNVIEVIDPIIVKVDIPDADVSVELTDLVINKFKEKEEEE